MGHEIKGLKVLNPFCMMGIDLMLAFGELEGLMVRV